MTYRNDEIFDDWLEEVARVLRAHGVDDSYLEPDAYALEACAAGWDPAYFADYLITEIKSEGF